MQKKNAPKSLSQPDSILLRQKAGFKGGKKTQKNKRTQKHRKWFFFYHGKPTVCCFNTTRGQEIVKILNTLIPSGLKRVSPMCNRVKVLMAGV